jgi:hypothetical protein
MMPATAVTLYILPMKTHFKASYVINICSAQTLLIQVITEYVRFYYYLLSSYFIT